MRRDSLGFGLAVKTVHKLGPHYGEQHHAAKLNEIDVDEIRRSNEPQAMIAERFGVHQSRISRIRAGKAWSQSSGEGK